CEDAAGKGPAHVFQHGIGGAGDDFGSGHEPAAQSCSTITYNGIRIAQMRRIVSNLVVLAISVIIIYIAYISIRIEQQSTRDEAQQADVIIVLGAAEYRGRPSPVLRARLDHALKLYRDGL